jgi:hypothetical protein
MKKILRAALGAAVGAIGLAACNAAESPNAVAPEPVESEAIAADETPVAPRPVEPEEVIDPEVLAIAESIADLVRKEDAFARARKLGELLPTLGPEAAPAMGLILEDPTLDYTATEVELLVRFWASHRPEEAARWAALKAPMIYRATAVLCAFRVWAEQDPHKVRAAIQRWGTQPIDVREAMHRGLVQGWFVANPSEAIQYIKEIGVSVERQRVVAAFVRAMIQTQGIGAVKRWAESIPEDDVTFKKTVYRQVAAALPLFDHEAGLGWCDAHCDGPYGSNLRSIIARRWVRTDGPAAMAWLTTVPEGYERNIALRAAFSVWARDEREAAMRWVEAQQAEELPSWLQPVLPGYVGLLAQESPLEAIEWAQRIEVDDEREFALIGVARAWRQVDEAAAEAWLLQSPLSEESREKVRAPERRRPRGRRGPGAMAPPPAQPESPPAEAGSPEP